MSPKKLALIKDPRMPSQLRGVTKTTGRMSKDLIQRAVLGRYQVKLCMSTWTSIIIPNFKKAKNAAKVFASFYEMKSELRVLFDNAKMTWPNLTVVTCEDVEENVAALDKEIQAKKEELALLERKKQANKALLTFKKTFVSASTALELITERYDFA